LANHARTRVSLLSNGYLLDEKTLKLLSENGLNWIQVSVDKIEEIRHFAKIIGIGSEMGIKMSIGTVLEKTDYGFLENFMAEIEKVKAYGWRILRYTPLNHKKMEQDFPSNQEWIQFLLHLEKLVRENKPDFQIRYEPSIIPFSWLKAQMADKKLDICGGRHARRLFFYPNGEVYACGLPRMNGKAIGNSITGLSNLAEKIMAAQMNSDLPRNYQSMQDYCTKDCRGGCLQMKEKDACDSRCDLTSGLVPVCCFEKFQISPGTSSLDEMIYPSELYSTWQAV